MRIALFALALLTPSTQAIAQAATDSPPTPQQRSLAAGYVALTTCSAVFTAQRLGAARSIESVRANELNGVYPEIATIVQSTQPIDDGVGYSAWWDEQMPLREARADARTDGCTLFPSGVGRQPGFDHVHGDPGRASLIFVPPDLSRPWPVGDSRALAPVPVEADTAFLDATIRAALDDGYGERTNTTAVVVVSNGRIVRERYADGFGIHIPQRTWSVAKSIAATIVGAAVQRGEVDVTAPAAIANWQDERDPRRAITLDHLLHMASGLTSDSAGNRTDGIYFGGVVVDEQAPGWPLIAQPGSTFRYANNDTLLATLAIAPTFAAHPPRAFFDSVNMHGTIAETDWRGNYVLSSQVWATARDLARFGMLYLNDGVWNGTRILPEGWRTYVSTPSGPQPPGDFGYGASFWLMNRSEGVPADTIAAFGNRGQYVVIVLSRNMVIVRRGEDPAGTRFDIAGFTRDVLAALE